MAPPNVDGVSTVNLTTAGFNSLLAQGFQLVLMPETHTLQLTDGTISVGPDASKNPPASSPPAGNNIVNLNGSSEVTLGTGANTVNVLAGTDTIFASAGSTTTFINQAPSGRTFFYAANSSGAAVDLLLGGMGRATLVGAANNTIACENIQTGPGVMMVAGSGSETLSGATSSTDDQFWGSFSGGSDLILGGFGNDILVAGNGNDTLVGGSPGNDVFFVINANIVSALTGTPALPGHDVIYDPHPGEVLALTGYDTLYGSAGSHAAATAVSSALASGSTTLALKDGSTISFVGPTQGLRVVSS